MTCRRNGVESVVSRQVYKGFLLPDRTEDVQAVIPILGLVEVVYSGRSGDGFFRSTAVLFVIACTRLIKILRRREGSRLRFIYDLLIYNLYYILG
jgi:hypothetical protein